MQINATKRLKEVFRLWTEAATNYEDPEGFRTFLNACIQALRNVTFVLQKQKSQIPHFDKWYPTWQAALKSNKIMKWCVSARNQIVKRGDLKTHSIALVTFHVSYFGSPKFEFDVDPSLTTDEIAKIICEENINHTDDLNGFIRIERRWITKDLPDYELLELLAYAWVVLVELLNDVEQQNGPEIFKSNDSIESLFVKSVESSEIKTAILPYCMSSFENFRTVWIKVPEMEILRFYTESEKLKPVSKEIVEKRYGIAKVSNDVKKLKSKLLKLSYYFIEQAKNNLRVDGRLLPVALLMDDKKNMLYAPIVYSDYSEKYVFWELLAKDIKDKQITSIITISEAWKALLDTDRPGIKPEHSKNRSEVIWITALSKSGEEYSLSLPFTRINSTIQFHSIILHEKHILNFLTPIKNIWFD